MAQILLKQVHKDGTFKSWILRDENKKYTFGKSKFCELISIDTQHEEVMGFFEQNSGEWYYIDLSKKSLKSSQQRIRVQQNFEFYFGETKFTADIINEKEKLLSRINNLKVQDPLQKEVSKTKKLLVTVSQGIILETQIVDRNYVVDHRDDDVEVIEREVILVPDEEIRRRRPFQEMDMDSVKIFGGSLLAGLLILAFSFTFQSTNLETPVAYDRPANAPIIITTPKELQQQKKRDEVKKAAAPEAKKTNRVAEAGGGSKNPRSSIAQGRISQLIGKISATSAKTKNVVVTTGVAAGTAPSGRALAMVGNVDRAGKDWGNENKNAGITVSTAGLGGKNSLKSALKQGSTGNAGVGLIEDEVEVGGGLDRDIIAQYIKSQLGHILYCYERQLSATPNLFGKVAVKFTIGGNGQVVTQKVGDSTLNSASVEGCILNRIAKWKFPAPKGGTQVIVTYPFLFKSTN